MQYTASRVVILSDNSDYAGTMKRWLEEDRNGWQCHIFTEEDRAARWQPYAEDLLLIHVEHLEEIEAWQPLLKAEFAGCPRLVVGDLRISGLFLSAIQDPFCTLLPAGPSPARLRETLSLLAQGSAQSALNVLRSYLMRQAESQEIKEKLARLIERQIECGCGLGLGLNNHRIGGILGISHVTVRTYIYDLGYRIERHHAEEIADYVRKALLAIKFVEQNPPMR